MNKKNALVIIIPLALACIIMPLAFAQLGVTINPSTPQKIDLGQSILFTSTVTSGSGNYAYQWYNNSTAVPGATNSSWNFAPKSTGSNTISLWVKDITLNETRTSTSTGVTVNPTLSLKITPSTTTIDSGQPLTLTANVANGTKPYKAIWWNLNNTQKQSGNITSWAFPTEPAGHYNVTCQVQDSSSVSGLYPMLVNWAWVTVNPTPSVSVSPSSIAIDVGQSKTFTSTVTGGTQPFTYQWCSNGAAVSGATSSSWTFTPSTSGSYSIYVNATDSVNFRVKSNIATATVNAAPTVSTSPYNTTWVDSAPLTFTETVAGGTAPYTYYWGHGTTIGQAYSDMGKNGPTTSNTWAFSFPNATNWIVICNVFDSASGTPVLGPWGSTAYVNVIHGYILQLSANVTVPTLAFTVNGTTYPAPNGAVTLPLKPGSYTITVNPTTYMIRWGRYWTKFQFVGWADGVGTATRTITLNQLTSLVADYYVTSNYGEN